MTKIIDAYKDLIIEQGEEMKRLKKEQNQAQKKVFELQRRWFITRGKISRIFTSKKINEDQRRELFKIAKKYL